MIRYHSTARSVIGTLGWEPAGLTRSVYAVIGVECRGLAYIMERFLSPASAVGP